MTAIGFMMLWGGSATALFLRDWDFALDAQSNRFMCAVLVAIAGLFSVLSGITIWLYQVMP